MIHAARIERYHVSPKTIFIKVDKNNREAEYIKPQFSNDWNGLEVIAMIYSRGRRPKKAEYGENGAEIPPEMLENNCEIVFSGIGEGRLLNALPLPIKIINTANAGG